MIESATGPYSIHLPSEIGPHGLPLQHNAGHGAIDPIHGSIMEPRPSIIVTVQWGDMHPARTTFVGDGIDPANGRTVEFDLGMLVGLVAGSTFDKIDPHEQKEIVQRARVDRYFLVIGAHDLESCLGGHKGILLWAQR